MGMLHSLWTISSVSIAGGVGVVGVSFAQISCILRRRRRCYIHCHLEAPFGKGWVGRKTSWQYHIPHWQEDRACVECPWRR